MKPIKNQIDLPKKPVIEASGRVASNDHQYASDQSALQRSIPPRWFEITLACLIGTMFFTAVEDGPYSFIMLIPIVGINFYQYLSSGMWPYSYYEKGNLLRNLKEDFSLCAPLNMSVLLGFPLIVYLLIDMIKFNSDRYIWPSVFGAILATAYTLIVMEVSRYLDKKKLTPPQD